LLKRSRFSRQRTPGDIDFFRSLPRSLPLRPLVLPNCVKALGSSANLKHHALQVHHSLRPLFTGTRRSGGSSCWSEDTVGKPPKPQRTASGKPKHMWEPVRRHLARQPCEPD
jgi:hypothetical protein